MKTSEAQRRLSGSYTRQLPPAARPTTVFWIFAAWFWGAVTVGALGLLEGLEVSAVPIINWSLVGALFLAYFFSTRLRAWFLAVDVRVLMSFHLLRFIGIYFFVLHDRGELPSSFAIGGGWGDIAVATSALAVIAFAPRDRPAGRVIYGVWNAVGLVDILAVLAMGVHEASADPSSMDAMLELPLCLLPTFIVPMILFTHMVIFLRLSSLAHRRANFF